MTNNPTPSRPGAVPGAQPVAWAIRGADGAFRNALLPWAQHRAEIEAGHWDTVKPEAAPHALVPLYTHPAPVAPCERCAAVNAIDVTDLWVSTDHPEFGIECTAVVNGNDQTVTNQPSVVEAIITAAKMARTVPNDDTREMKRAARSNLTATTIKATFTPHPDAAARDAARLDSRTIRLPYRDEFGEATHIVYCDIDLRAAIDAAMRASEHGGEG